MVTHNYNLFWSKKNQETNQFINGDHILFILFYTTILVHSCAAN